MSEKEKRSTYEKKTCESVKKKGDRKEGTLYAGKIEESPLRCG